MSAILQPALQLQGGAQALARALCVLRHHSVPFLVQRGGVAVRAFVDGVPARAAALDQLGRLAGLKLFEEAVGGMVRLPPAPESQRNGAAVLFVDANGEPMQLDHAQARADVIALGLKPLDGIRTPGIEDDVIGFVLQEPPLPEQMPRLWELLTLYNEEAVGKFRLVGPPAPLVFIPQHLDDAARLLGARKPRRARAAAPTAPPRPPLGAAAAGAGVVAGGAPAAPAAGAVGAVVSGGGAPPGGAVRSVAGPPPPPRRDASRERLDAARPAAPASAGSGAPGGPVGTGAPAAGAVPGAAAQPDAADPAAAPEAGLRTRPPSPAAGAGDAELPGAGAGAAGQAVPAAAQAVGGVPPADGGQGRAGGAGSVAAGGAVAGH